MKFSFIPYFLAFVVCSSCAEQYDEVFVSRQTKSTLADYYEKADKLLDTDPVQAEKLASRALQLSESQSYTQGLGDAHFMLGLACEYQGKYGQAVSHHLQGLHEREVVHDSYGMIRSYNNLARVYLVLELYKDAQTYFEKGLKLAVELDYKEEQAKINYNLGQLFKTLKAYDKSQHYYAKALALYEKIGSQKYMSYVYNELARLNEVDSNKTLQQAISYYQKSLQIAQESNSLQEKGWALGNIGRTYIKLGNPKEALLHLAQAEPLLQNDYLNLTKTLTAKAEAYMALEDNQSAQKVLQQAEALEPKLVGVQKESVQDVYKLARQLASYEQWKVYKEKEKRLEAQLNLIIQDGRNERFKNEATVRKAESDYHSSYSAQTEYLNRMLTIAISVIVLCLGVIVYLFLRYRKMARSYHEFIQVTVRGLSHLS